MNQSEFRSYTTKEQHLIQFLRRLYAIDSEVAVWLVTVCSQDIYRYSRITVSSAKEWWELCNISAMCVWARTPFSLDRMRDIWRQMQ